MFIFNKKHIYPSLKIILLKRFLIKKFCFFFSEGGGNVPSLPISVSASANCFNRTAAVAAARRSSIISSGALIDFGNGNGLKRKKKTCQQTVLGRLHYLCRKYNVQNEQDFQCLIFTSCESEDAEELLNIYSEKENISEYFVSLHNMLRQEDICLRIQRMDNNCLSSLRYKYYTDTESLVRLSQMCSLNKIDVNEFVDNVMMLLRGQISCLFIGGTYVSPIVELLRCAVNDDVVTLKDNRIGSLLIYYSNSSLVNVPDMSASPMLVVCTGYRQVNSFFYFSDPSTARTTKMIHPSVLLNIYGRVRSSTLV